MDAETFQHQVMQVQKLLFRIAWSYMGNLPDVEDMVQDAIEIAWAKRSTLRDSRQFAGWIARILTNRCKNALRRRRVVSFFPLEEGSAIVQGPTEEPPVVEALARLKPELRLLMALRYTDGYTMQDIAQALGIPLGTVQTRLMRARKQLKDILMVEWEGEL